MSLTPPPGAPGGGVFFWAGVCTRMAAAREAGTLSQEGKDNGVKDGDIVHSRFNV